MTMRMVFHNKSSKKFPLYSDYNPNSCNHGLPGPVTSPLHLLFPVHEISSSAPSYDGSIPSLRALLQIYLFREVFQVYLFKRELIPLLSYSFFFTTLTVWNGTKMFFMSFFPHFLAALWHMELPGQDQIWASVRTYVWCSCLNSCQGGAWTCILVLQRCCQFCSVSAETPISIFS